MRRSKLFKIKETRVRPFLTEVLFHVFYLEQSQIFDWVIFANQKKSHPERPSYGLCGILFCSSENKLSSRVFVGHRVLQFMFFVRVRPSMPRTPCSWVACRGHVQASQQSLLFVDIVGLGSSTGVLYWLVTHSEPNRKKGGSQKRCHPNTPSSRL